jgi:hypothetical protein
VVVVDTEAVDLAVSQAVDMEEEEVLEAADLVGAMVDTEARVDLVGAIVRMVAEVMEVSEVVAMGVASEAVDMEVEVEDSEEVMANMDRSNYVKNAQMFFRDFLINRVIIPRLLHEIYI